MTGDGERPASDHAARQMIAAFVAALMSERENRIDERAGTLASSLSEQVVRVHLALALHIDEPGSIGENSAFIAIRAAPTTITTIAPAGCIHRR